MLIAIKVRIYPTPDQAEFLERQFGCVRYVWNRALEIKEHYYRIKGINLSPFKDLKPLLAVAKRHEKYAWLKEADSVALQQALINLDRAYKNFFEKRAGKPRFKSKRRRQSSYHCVGVKVLDNAIKIPKCTPIKARIHRPIEGDLKSITLSKSPSGKYYAAILVENGKPMPQPCKVLEADKIVALDMGLKNFTIASTGEVLKNPRYLLRAERNLKRKQKQLSRKKKGSVKWQKAKRKLANAHERLKNVRADTLHKWSRRLADENQAVIVETLRVRNMMQNHRLAKSIGDAAWGMFLNMLEYKLQRQGKTLVRIDPWYPSSKTCSYCGYRMEKMPLHVRAWTCPSCGHAHDRDFNASLNLYKQGIVDLKAKGFELKAAGRSSLPVEAA